MTTVLLVPPFVEVRLNPTPTGRVERFLLLVVYLIVFVRASNFFLF